MNICRCRVRHKTYRTSAKCRFPNADWISGNGPIALLAHCRVLTVTLWKDRVLAEKQKAVIDNDACGGRCFKDHEILVYPW